MFRLLSRFRAWQARRREAAAVAIRCFEAQTGGRGDPRTTYVIHEDAAGYVVRVCHGDARPPHRAWVWVAADFAHSRVLTFAEVEPLGERPNR
jgi:hypothetical protein